MQSHDKVRKAHAVAVTNPSFPLLVDCGGEISLTCRPSSSFRGSSLKRCFAFTCRFLNRSLQRAQSVPEEFTGSVRWHVLLLQVACGDDWTSWGSFALEEGSAWVGVSVSLAEDASTLDVATTGALVFVSGLCSTAVVWRLLVPDVEASLP